MTFWILTLAMAVLVAALLGLAVSRGAQRRLTEAAAYDLKVYRDQLAEVERDVARGVVSPDDAERIRTEISRRILAADAAQTKAQGAGSGPRPALVAVMALALIGGSLGLYWQIGQPGYGDLSLSSRIAYAEELRKSRPSQADYLADLPAQPPREDLSPRYAKLMEQLRSTVANRPGDLQGQMLLAQNEASIGNFAAAATAQRRVLELRGEAVTADEITDYAELMIMAAGGYVSPEAEAALSAALNRDKDNGRARYYSGLMMVQTGRPDIAFRIWDALLRRGPADAPWIAPIRAQIPDLAQLAGVDYTLPDIGSTAPGPSSDDIAAAADMTPAERMEMIRGMVSGLSDRLATEGGPPEDWARLITALGALGETDRALAIFDNAMEVFAGNPAALDRIRAAGSRAGVAE